MAEIEDTQFKGNVKPIKPVLGLNEENKSPIFKFLSLFLIFLKILFLSLKKIKTY
jgi:hypothetical protein